MKPLLTAFLLLFLQTAFAQNNEACADTSYRMRFSSPGKDFGFYGHCNTADGGTVLVGRLIDITANTSEVVILKLSATGGVVWKTKYRTENTSWRFSRIIEQSNGEIAAFGYASSENKIILSKWDRNGTLLWSRNYYLSSNFDQADELRPYFLSEGLNNDLLFSLKGEHIDTTNGLSDNTYAIISRINNNGGLIWSKVFGGTETYSTHPAGVYLHKGEIYAFGYSDNSNASCFIGGIRTSLYAMRLNYTTGDLLQLKTYCHDGGQNVSFELLGSPELFMYNSAKLSNNQFALFGNFSPENGKRYLYKLLLSDELNIVQAQQYTLATAFGYTPRMKVFPDGTTHITTIGGGAKSIYWAAIAPSNNIIRERKLAFNSGDSSVSSFLTFDYKNSDSYNFSNNYRVNGQRFSLFTQLQSNDPSIDSCLGTDTSFISSAPISYTPNSWMWRSISDDAVLSANAALVPSDFIIDTENLCTQVSRCDSLRIAGPDTLCVTDDFINFTGLKNPDCRKRVLWEINNQLIDSSYQPNDSTISIRFKPLPSATAQTLSLFASAANCTIAKDTAQLVLLPGLKRLPEDTVVCGDVNMRLTPGKWGRAYRWQDGSTDSVFIATDTGRYFLQVETTCGGTFYDTIQITKPTVSLGSDKTICAGDTVTLRATPGFSNYQWLLQGASTTLSDSVIKAYPADTTQYIVSAQTGSGCMVKDSIRITVLHSAKINLGNDTTFCRGDSLQLTAPPSFVSYRWNTGSTSSSITAKNSGTYSVSAIYPNGCSSADSINILPLYPTPVVSVLPEKVVCLGQNDTLRTGLFVSYEWSNGSTETFLPVSDTGKFWLKVRDANGCTGSDTASITKIALPPKRFLPADTIVCAGTVLELKPVMLFNRYLWSTGAASPSIEAGAAGNYFLGVTDKDGCTGTDSISVLHKHCPNRLLFPSAFSPNDDHRNDIFKPFVQGHLTEYRFSVYNRWGEVVFSTTDYRKGWDGYLGGLLQNTGAFVWLCQYQFSGEEKKMEKGSLMLIR